MKLKNKIIIITGASDGIGKQIALKLAKENTKLALIARDEVRLKKVVENAKKLGAVKVKGYMCDIRQTNELKNTIKSIITDFKKIDILINNAGIWQKLSEVDKIDNGEINNIIESNLTSHIQLTNIILPILRKQKESAIINISSKSGVVAQAGQSVYTASKYGMRGFTEVLKTDLKDSNVKVAGVYQGGTNTNMFRKVGDNFDTKNLTNPSDLADVIVYMLSRPNKIWIHDIRIDH